MRPNHIQVADKGNDSTICPFEPSWANQSVKHKRNHNKRTIGSKRPSASWFEVLEGHWSSERLNRPPDTERSILIPDTDSAIRYWVRKAACDSPKVCESFSQTIGRPWKAGNSNHLPWNTKEQVSKVTRAGESTPQRHNAACETLAWYRWYAPSVPVR